MEINRLEQAGEHERAKAMRDKQPAPLMEERLLAAVVGYAILLLIVGAFIWLRAARGWAERFAI